MFRSTTALKIRHPQQHKHQQHKQPAYHSLVRPGVHHSLLNTLILIITQNRPNYTPIKMVSYRIITLLALAATGVIAAPCEAGNGNAAAGTGVAAANNAQATGAAGNAQGGAGGNAMGGGAGGNAQGGAGGNAQATGAAGNAQQGGAGGNAQGGAAGGACPPVTTNEAQGPDNVGVDGAQFVTGQCTSDANCASGCCVQGGGNDPNLAVCRNEPALSPDESCGFTCN